MEKTAVVTGASRGIGAAIATALGADAYRVDVCYRSQREKAEAVCRAIVANGGTAVPFLFDCDSKQPPGIHQPPKPWQWQRQFRGDGGSFSGECGGRGKCAAVVSSGSRNVGANGDSD